MYCSATRMILQSSNFAYGYVGRLIIASSPILSQRRRSSYIFVLSQLVSPHHPFKSWSLVVIYFVCGPFLIRLFIVGQAAICHID